MTTVKPIRRSLKAGLGLDSPDDGRDHDEFANIEIRDEDFHKIQDDDDDELIRSGLKALRYGARVDFFSRYD